MDSQILDTCTSCLLEVRKLQQKLACSSCSELYHRTCVKDVSQATFRNWKRDGLLEDWLCSECNGDASRFLPTSPVNEISTSSLLSSTQINGNAYATSLPSPQLNGNSSSPPSNTTGISSSVPTTAPHIAGISTSVPTTAPHTAGISSSVPTTAPHTAGISASVPATAPHTDRISASMPKNAPHADRISYSVPAAVPVTDKISSSESTLSETTQQTDEGLCDSGIHGISQEDEDTTLDFKVPSSPFYEVLSEVVPFQPFVYMGPPSIYFFMDSEFLKQPREKRPADVKVHCCLGKKGTKTEAESVKVDVNLYSQVVENLSIMDVSEEGSVDEPFDITNYCRPGLNTITFFPGSFTKMFQNTYIWVHIVKVLTAEQLCKRLEEKRIQHPDCTTTLVKQQLSKAKSASSVCTSLLCPIGKTRLRYPCRGRSCTHVQCVDALNMINMNQKKHQWSCQVCSKPCSYDDLVIDGLFMKILKSTSTAVSVELRQDGTWNLEKSYSCCSIHGASPSVVNKKGRVSYWPYYELVAELVPFQEVEAGKHINERVTYLNRNQTSQKSTCGTKIWLGFSLKVRQPNSVLIQPGVVYVNGNQISSVYRPIKKGCVYEPIDITAYCNRTQSNRLRVSNLNKGQFHLSDYNWWVHEVRDFSVEELCEKLVKERLVHPDHTTKLVENLFKADEESGIAATSIHASLVCPIGKTRLRHPCRGKLCTHLQCVDAATMVSLNWKKLQWSCQVCSKPCSYEDLAIDGLFMEILKAVPDTVTEVEFSEDGSWTYKREKVKETTANKENDMSVIELDLSHTLEMIDLTETDEENSPVRKKPEQTKGKTPLKTNTALLNTVSESAGDTLGQNYQQSNLSNCHRKKHKKHYSQPTNQPYNRYHSNNPAGWRAHNNYNSNNRHYITGYNRYNQYNQPAYNPRWSERAQIHVRRAITSISDYFRTNTRNYNEDSYT